jgi:hypothetical protein
MSVGLHEIHEYAVGRGSRFGLREVTTGQIKCRHAGAASSQYDSGHAVAAPEIQNAPAAHVPKLLDRRADPCFVVKVTGVAKLKCPRGDSKG